MLIKSPLSLKRKSKSKTVFLPRRLISLASTACAFVKNILVYRLGKGAGCAPTCVEHIFVFFYVCATDFLCNVPTYLIKFEHSQPLPRSFWPCSLQSLGLEQLESWTGPEPPEGTSLEPLPFEFGLKKWNGGDSTGDQME